MSIGSLQLSKDIKLVISDFDGVFTDGGIYVFDDFKTSKKLSFKDIMAVSLLIKNGYKFAIVSGESSSAVEYVKTKFALEDVFQGIRQKASVVKEIMEKYSLLPEEVIYIGDDVNDIDSLNLVKYKIAPPNSNYKVKSMPEIQITRAVGGDGAFREVVDSLLELG